MIAGTAVGALLALIVFAVARAYRGGWRPSLDPVVAYTPLPEPEPRPVRALPAPQIINNFYGFTPDQVADALARQQRVIER